jgi:glycosyltransferase involved in cell wall biosynthesis
MKVVIFTQSPLSKAPRVVKEANCLAKCGFELIVFCPWYDNDIVMRDSKLLLKNIQFKAGIDLRDNGAKTLFLRLERRLYRELARYLGIESNRSLGYGYFDYLKNLKSEKAQLYIGHEEMSMSLAKDLIKLNYNVAFDFEDYHSEDLLLRDRKYRPLKLLEHLEGYLLRYAKFSTTTSDSLAVEMASKYKTKIPETIYNSIYRNEIFTEVSFKQTNSLVWISQVIGPGRGIEQIIDGIGYAENTYNLTLIGGAQDVKYCQNLQKNLPSNLNLVLSEYLAPEKIQKELAKYDLGIAFEEYNPKSRALTITNKIFHYLNSGIAILATDTAGQKEISLKSENAIKIVSPNSQEIAVALDVIFNNPEILKKMKESSQYCGQKKFCFENEERKIKELVNNALE